MITSSPGMRAMPRRVWKKDKDEKGKEEKGESKVEKGPKAEKPASQEAKAEILEPQTKKPEEKKPEPAAPTRPPQPGDAEGAIGEAHAALVDLGLTVPLTKGVFAKRVAAYPGGEMAFVADYRTEPYRAVTRVLGDWLGFRVPEVFEPDVLLKEINPRLSSFKLNVQLKELTWLDQELNLQKADLLLGEQKKIVRFTDVGSLVKSVNELLAPKKLAFLELETWDDDFAFLLIREPRWDKIAGTNP